MRASLLIFAAAAGWIYLPAEQMSARGGSVKNAQLQ